MVARRVAALFLGLGFACTTGSAPPPEWFSRPPASDARFLFFVGDATGAPDPALARETAISKALASLTQFCGAVVTSDFRSVEREQNGVLEQTVSLTVDVAGEELTLREAVVEETTTRPAGRGHDGFARIRWPRAQYQRVLAMQQARGQRALAVFTEAEAAFASARVGPARTLLREARAILGPARAQTPLEDRRFSHTGLLFDAIGQLGERVEAFERDRRSRIAVGVDCQEGGKTASCPNQRVGRLQEQVSASGLLVASAELPPTLARQIASGAAPDVDGPARNAGFVLAATYDIKMLGEENGFVFAHCGARGVLFDTEQRTIVASREVSPKKGGHLDFPKAAEVGCLEAEQDLMRWIPAAIGQVRAEEAPR